MPTSVWIKCFTGIHHTYQAHTLVLQPPPSVTRQLQSTQSCRTPCVQSWVISVRGHRCEEMWGCPLVSSAFPLERGNSCQWSRSTGAQLGTEGGIVLFQLLPDLWLEQKDSPLLLVCLHVDVGDYNQPKTWYVLGSSDFKSTLSSHSCYHDPRHMVWADDPYCTSTHNNILRD